ncbi:hypothetical protein ALC57_13145 [Trachymyrmex cornetzi]|uniref:Helix-turn-helix domain-containing protein n=1 Tax=Trachymyrmex cornetzi TaxID=471704 RepID=A0A151J0A7_9HYME|nr:hypothetical protein ALC57_13145 [Trachymyrmex cornetzi]
MKPYANLNNCIFEFIRYLFYIWYEKSFTNLSSVSIPECVQCFLQLGENFSLPINYNSKLIFEFIKNVEFNIKKLQTSLHNSVRNNSIAIINNPFSLKQKRNFVVKKLKKATRLTKQFLKDNNNIIFIKADKGNLTVALDKTIIKVKTMLDNEDHQKPTFSGKFLNFLSQHAISQKKDIIFNFVDKVFYISHPNFHKKNLEFVVRILLENNYPLDFIFDTINKRES